MKKNDSLIKIISLFMFLALAAYLGVYIAQRLLNPVQTALTVTATMNDSASMSGLVVREELVIKSSEQYIDVTAADGEKVSAGQTIAVAYTSEEALDRAADLHALSREIEDVTAALSDTSGTQVTGDREQSIYNAIIGLSTCLRSGDLTSVETQESTLTSLLFQTETTDTTEEYLAELQSSYDQLLATSAEDTSDITVGQSGTFSSVVDGYEGVDPEYVMDLTPSGLRELIAADRVVSQDALGKLITSYYWYYAAIVPRDVARELEAGDEVQLSFGRYYSGFLDAEVYDLGEVEDSEQLVLFRMERGLTDMLAVRAVSAELVYEQYTGLRVPIKGLYRYYAGYLSDEDGQRLTEGQSVTLTLGGVDYTATVSEIGSASAYGELPDGVEADSEDDTRPKRRLVVFVWPWEEGDGPDFSAGSGTVTLTEAGQSMIVSNYYDYDPDTDRLCVFTMTGLQAERKKVELIFAGEEYCLVSSDGTDALREGNEVIVQATNLYNGKVFE